MPASKLNAEDIDYLFLRLSVIYGHLWMGLYRDEGFLYLAKQEWLTGLQAFDRETLEKVLRRCREVYETPPTLPKLFQLCQTCLSRLPNTQTNTFERGSPEVAEKYLQRIAEILGKRRQN